MADLETLTADEQLQVAWTLFGSFECNVRQLPSRLPTRDPRFVSIRNRFDTLNDNQKRNIGPFIHSYKTAYKALQDSVAHSNYAVRYRGAKNDEGDEDDWRPRFEYFARRRKETLKATEKAKQAANDLLGQLRLYGLADQAVEDALDGKIELWKENIPRMQDELDEVHPRWKLTAQQRIADPEFGKAAKRGKLAEKNNLAKKDEPAREDEEMADAEMSDDSPHDAANVPTPAELKWYGSVVLGKGGFGQADLWIGVDDKDIIRKRVVRKNCILKDSIWNAHRYWSNGAPGLTLRTNTLPMEIHALQELADKPGSDSVVQILSHKLDLVSRQLDIYMEYCPHGDCWGIIAGTYGSHTHTGRIEYPYFDYSSKVEMVPEPFIWSAFLSLVTAGLLMERGSLNKETADPNWAVIVHRDIKLPNVFLGLPADDKFRNYPQCKMADFGMAIRIPKSDTRNPAGLQYQGSPGHAAPEMHGALIGSNGRTLPQSTKTNVWGAGILLYSLLAGKSGTKQADGTHWFDWTIAARKEPPEFDRTATKKYSAELRNLVLAYLRYDAEDRPPFDFLMREIRKHTGDGEAGDERAAGMRDIEVPEEDWTAKHDSWLKLQRRDEYLVGSAVKETRWWKDVGVQDLSVPDALMDLAL